jgi:hypothetical protein
VTVTSIVPGAERRDEMFVLNRWQDRPLAVPLAQLEFRGRRAVDLETRGAVADRPYWLDQGHVR